MAFHHVVSSLLDPLLKHPKSALAITSALGLLLLERERRNRDAERMLRPVLTRRTRSKHTGRIDGEFLRRLLYILRSSFPLLSRETINALALACALIGRTFLTLVIAGNMGRSLKFLTARNWESLWHNIGDFVIITIPAAVLNAALRFLTSELELNIRDKVTARVHELYMQHRNYYWANKVGTHRLENADQLIAEDVQKFALGLSEVYSNSLKPMVDFVIFSIQLSMLTGPRGPLGMYAYFAFSAWVASMVLPAYGQQAVRQQELEGNFRARHNRLIECGEQVAFMGGERPEAALLDSDFTAIRDFTAYTHRRHAAAYSVMSFVNKYLANIQGMALLILPVLLNEGGRGNLNDSEMVGFYVETRQIMENLSDSVLRFFDVQKQLGTLAGLTTRVYNLLHTLKVPEVLELPSDASNPPRFVNDNELRFDRVNVYKPDGTLLVRELTFSVPHGTRIIVTGENGAGKTSLFRVLRGLWPLASGTITTPPPSSLKSFYFLSQVNFVPIGSLREIIVYPQAPTCTEEEDARLWEILKWSHIEDISVHGIRPTMATVLDWQSALSPGQKQRMAFARLLYHSPQYAVLDECTNGIQPDVELDLYNRCQTLGITVFSISHKIELKQLHDFELHYDGNGGYQLIDLRASR